MSDRTARLNAIMEDHKLKPAQVGKMLEREPQTVRAWRCRWKGRAIPAHSLALLELKVAAGQIEAPRA